jgi:hypothetical protein
MRTSNFTGMGDSFPVHDAFACESMGAIQDRTKENLATSDRIIAQARRLIMDSIKKVQEGQPPLHCMRGSNKSDVANIVVISEVIPNDASHKEFWKSKVQRPQAAE